MVAVAGVTELHTPPTTVLLNVELAPGQIVSIPFMIPAFGAALTVTTLVAAADPQTPFTVYDMVDVPKVTPVTTPVEPTVATAGVTELQIPPVTASLSAVVAPGQTVAVPVIVPAFVEGLTVTIFVAAAVPQLVLTV